MSFVRSANPIWYEFNATGAIFNDTYWAFFLSNTAPYNPQAVYEDPNGVTPWSNPLQFGANGGLPNNLYFNPAQTYRIQFRQGPLSSSPLIYEIDNFVPSSQSSISSNSALTSENLITNPQFADISFTSPLTITTAGTYQIAPGWSLVLTGSGSITLTQVAYAGTNDIAGNPPYALQIQNTGFTTVNLIQTFSNNGAIFQGGAILFNISALANSITQSITINYVPSSGASTQLATGTAAIGVFTPIQGFVDIPDGSNANTPPNAYVNIVINLSSTSNIELTNISLTGQSAPISAVVNPLPTFQELTYEREVDYEFHLYKSQLMFKPIPSYLVGWDFPLNPAQATGHSISASANTVFYSWDQTVFFQSAASAFTIAQSADGAFTVAAATTNPQFAIIQYLPAKTAIEILNNVLSANFYGYCDSGQTVPINISLWYTTGALPSAGSGNCAITALASDGHPTGASGWTEVPYLNGQHANATVLPQSTSVMNYGFSNWNLNSSSAAASATFIAIVVGTGTITNTKALYIRSVSLVPGYIATQPAPQAPDEVLRECQRYYEMSYNIGTLPGTVTANGAASYIASLANPKLAGLNVPFKVNKYNTPNITWISPGTGSNPDVYDVDSTSDATVSSIGNVPNTGSTGYPVLNANATVGNLYIAHWVADSRLGK